MSDTIGDNMRILRGLHGWTQADLAIRLASLGAGHLTAGVLYNIESGRTGRRQTTRREVSADEWTALALALDVAPVHLAVPFDDDTQVQLTSTFSDEAYRVRQWFRGHLPLRGTDKRIYSNWAPDREVRRPHAEQLAEMIDAGVIQVVTGQKEEQ